MPDRLEEAVLSGALFVDPSLTLDSLTEYRAPSPSFSNDISPVNTDDELGSDLDEDHAPHQSVNSITRREYTYTPSLPLAPGSQQSTRTGPKGVLQDSRNAKAEARAKQVEATVKGTADMERRALLGSTWEEEERMRKEEDRKKRGETGGSHDDEDDVKERRRLKRLGELGGVGPDTFDAGAARGGGSKRKGYLREVGMEGYLRAVEDSGWTIVLVYEASLPSLKTLIPSLQHLAAICPPPTHNFLLAKASSLSFMLQNSGEPDLDVLPTMLIYSPEGDLIETAVRVDLDLQGKGNDGLELLLIRLGVLPPSRLYSGRLDEDESESEDDDYSDE